MKILSFLEKNNIATKETLQIFVGIVYLYFLSWFLLKHNLSWWSLSLMFIVLGGTANLYAIDFNNLRMPVLARNWREFSRFKKMNPSRRMSMLNKQTKLGWLCDRFWVGKQIYSIGDFMVFFGTALAVLPFVVGALGLIK